MGLSLKSAGLPPTMLHKEDCSQWDRVLLRDWVEVRCRTSAFGPPAKVAEIVGLRSAHPYQGRLTKVSA